VTSPRITISGLPHRCKITMVVWAHNAGGDGVPKKITVTTKDAPPGAVVGLTPIVIDGAVRLKWKPPVTHGESAPLGYRVTAMTGSSVLVVETVSTLGVDLPRMPAHVVVAFMVTPVNWAGAGTPDIVTTVPGIAIRPVGSAHPSVKAGRPFVLQVKVSTAFGGIPLGRDAVEVLARHGNGWVRVGRLLTASNGVATFHGLIRSPAQVVLRPASHSVQGVLFRVGVH
jgi:hypothetical protein